MRKIRFADFFAGTGGIRLAFEQALRSFGVEGECVKSVEINPDACETYKMNFGDDPHGDIREVRELPPVDVILSGFPCQAFSYAGLQKGFADTRGTLFFEVERLLEKYRPQLCFLENVRGLTTHDKGRTFATILARLNDLGYHVEYRLVNASSHGVPQNRTRIYIVCVRDVAPQIEMMSDVGAADSHKFKDGQLSLFGDNADPKLVRDILEDSPDAKYDVSPAYRAALTAALGGSLDKISGVRMIDTRHGNSIHSWDIGRKGKCSNAEIEFMNLLVSNRRKHEFGTHQDGKALSIDQIRTFYDKPDLEDVLASLLGKGYVKRESNGKINLVCGNMSFEVFKFLDPESVSITLTSSDCNRLGVYHNGRLRRITPRECARIQGYPETYKVNPKDACAYKQFGNAVCVPVIQKIFEDLFAHTPKLLSSLKSGKPIAQPNAECELRRKCG